MPTPESYSPYRTPQNPGFIGAYQWKQVVFCLVLMLFSNLAGTQYVAAHFRYQYALGIPLYRTDGFALYEPFHWTLWVLRYSSNTNPAITQPVMAGAAIALVGAMLVLGLFAAMSFQRTKRLSKGNEDLYGSARWATKEEIKESGLMDSDKGVYVGGWQDSENYVHYLRHNGPEHVLAFAPTRSGKGVGLVIPTLLAWDESVLVYDIKGENWAKTAGFRASMGTACFKFSPVEEGSSSRFNPLAEVRICTPRDVSDAQNIADMLVRTGHDSPSERYWQDAGASIMTGMVLHTCYAAAAEGRTATLSELAGVFTKPGQSFRDTLAEIMNYPHDPNLKFNWTTPEGELTGTHPVVREKTQEMLDKEDKDFSGVLSTAKTALTLFSDPLVVRNTASSDFHIADLLNSDKPLSVYLVVPPSDKIRLRPLVRLIFTMVVNRLTEKMDFEGATLKKPKNRLLFMIDEFPSLNRMEIFADALSYMGGYGLKAYLITQDIRQIVEQYGTYESIVSNCHVRIAYAPNQQDTKELLSEMAGKRTIQKASFNYSGSRMSPMMGHVNASVQQVERPLLTPDEVGRMKPPKKEGKGDKERIVAPGDMLIFQAGQYPIYGTQILYFTDPILSQRASLPPPTTLYQIINGALCAREEEQKPKVSLSNTVGASDGGPSAELDPTNLPSEYLEEIGRLRASTSQVTPVAATNNEHDKTSIERSR